MRQAILWRMVVVGGHRRRLQTCGYECNVDRCRPFSTVVEGIDIGQSDRELSR
jgi:hypothetical protein